MFALAVPGTIAKAATNNSANAETITRADLCIHPPRPRRVRRAYEINGALQRTFIRIPSIPRREDNYARLHQDGDGGPTCDRHGEPPRCSERPELGQPEVNIGIIPGFGGSQRLPRLVGPGWAAEMVYTGDRIDAATAERIGLVNRVVPADRLIAEAKSLAHKILEKSPAAIALAKACLRAAWDMPLSAGLDFETAAFGIVGSTHDKAEGMRAFIEKRKPAWTGA